jgi:hypothetical protein
MEVMGVLGTRRIGRHLAILLAHLMTKLAKIDQLEYVGHRVPLLKVIGRRELLV